MRKVSEYRENASATPDLSEQVADAHALLRTQGGACLCGYRWPRAVIAPAFIGGLWCGGRGIAALCCWPALAPLEYEIRIEAIDGPTLDFADRFDRAVFDVATRPEMVGRAHFARLPFGEIPDNTTLPPGRGYYAITRHEEPGVFRRAVAQLRRGAVLPHDDEAGLHALFDHIVEHGQVVDRTGWALLLHRCDAYGLGEDASPS